MLFLLQHLTTTTRPQYNISGLQLNGQQETDSFWGVIHREAPKTRRETKTRSQWNLKPLVPITTTNIKHSKTPSQININLYTRGLFTFILLPNKSDLTFSKKLQGMPKIKKSTVWRDTAIISIDSNTVQMLEISDREFKITMINM